MSNPYCIVHGIEMDLSIINLCYTCPECDREQEEKDLHNQILKDAWRREKKNV